MISRLFCIVTFALVAAPHATVFAEDSIPNFVANKSLIVAQVGNSNQFAAYSKHTGEWTTHTFPDGVKAVPVAGTHLIAFSLEGESIANLVAVDANGKWQVHKLAETNAKNFVPHVGKNIAIYQADSSAYGFSGGIGAWDSVPSKAMPDLTDDSAMIVEPDKISVFSVLSGKWSTSPDLSP